jgi:hypothetical protein
VSGLPGTPKAVLFWTTGATALDTLATDGFPMVGMTSGASQSGSVGAYTVGGADPTRVGQRAAAKAITLLQHDQAVKAECDLSSFGAGSFTLDWTTNDSATTQIHYLAIGGTSVSAKVTGQWRNSGAGSTTLTGAGFTPTTAILLAAQNVTSSPLPQDLNGMGISLGVMRASDQQWVNLAAEGDNLATADAWQAMRTDFAVAQANLLGSYTLGLAYSAFNADGAVLTASADATQNYIFTLWLAGISAKAGSFTRRFNLGTDVVTGAGFAPAAGLFVYSPVTNGAAFPVANSRLSIGAASDSGPKAASSFSSQRSTATADVDVRGSAASVLTYLNNSGTILVQATGCTLDADGFTITWGTVDGVQTIVNYLLLGGEDPP